MNRSNIDPSLVEMNTHSEAIKTDMWIAYRCTHPEADEKTQPPCLHVGSNPHDRMDTIPGCEEQ